MRQPRMTSAGSFLEITAPGSAGFGFQGNRVAAGKTLFEDPSAAPAAKGVGAFKVGLEENVAFGRRSWVLSEQASRTDAQAPEHYLPEEKNNNTPVYLARHHGANSVTAQRKRHRLLSPSLKQWPFRPVYAKRWLQVADQDAFLICSGP